MGDIGARPGTRPRSVRTDERVWYVLAGTTYVVLSLWHKWLLNWFVGPAWLVATVVVGPWLAGRVARVIRRRPVSAP